jgi:hypothetical protein
MSSAFSRSFVSLTAAVAALIELTATTDAGQRRFAYSYESTTAAKGEIEIENWVTYKHRAGEGKDLDQFDFRHELEFGVTDRLQLAVYVADWTYNSSDTEHKSRYQHSGVEAIYNLTNPTTSFLGSAVYLEALIGEEAFEVEGKLLFEKNFGAWTIVYNVGMEAEWEGEKFGSYDERNGEFFQSVGVAYDVTKNFSVGAELLHEVEMEDWGHSGPAMVFAGPNMSFRAGRFFATIAGLFQLTREDEEPDVQTRLIVGVDF